MNTQKAPYETSIIVNASLEDNQIETVVNRVQESIVKSGGEIVEVIKWGRKRLAYPIKKKNNGYYIIFEYNGLPTTVRQLEQSLPTSFAEHAKCCVCGGF